MQSLSNGGNLIFDSLSEQQKQVLLLSFLFDGINREDLPSLLKCLNAEKKTFDKNTFIFSAGDRVGQIGIVLSGNVHILQEDFWGNRFIFVLLSKGGIFGEAFAAAGLKSMPVSVFSVDKTEVLLIDSLNAMQACVNTCDFHFKLIYNLVKILATKNVALTQKAELLSRKSTKEKLLGYLSSEAIKKGKDTFDIPLNRQQLADYLSVDRSAMSQELSKMQNEGILSYHLNSFKLIKQKT